MTYPERYPEHRPGPSTANLADILERVLDKGIVIAGDIKIDLLDIELLTIRLRLFVASVDTARKAGIISQSGKTGAMLSDGTSARTATGGGNVIAHPRRRRSPARRRRGWRL